MKTPAWAEEICDSSKISVLHTKSLINHKENTIILVYLLTKTERLPVQNLVYLIKRRKAIQSPAANLCNND